MKKIINGKVYDTEKARSIGSIFSGAYGRDLNFWRKELFRKRTGEYFLHCEGGPMTVYRKFVSDNEWCSGEKIFPFCYDEAKKWAFAHLTTEEYQQEFGAAPEETGNT